MKTEKQKQGEYESLSLFQQETYNTLVEEKVLHEMAFALARRYDLVDVELAISEKHRMRIPIQEYFMFMVQLKELTTTEKKLYYEIIGKFGTEPGDKYLAMQMVRDYDTELLQEIVSKHQKGALTIDVFAMENVHRKCRFKIVTVEPEEEVDPGYTDTCPF